MKSAKQMVLENLEQQTFAFVTDDEDWVEIKRRFRVDPDVYQSPNYAPQMRDRQKQSPLAVKPTAAVSPVKPIQVNDEALPTLYCKNYGMCKRRGFDKFACEHKCIFVDGSWQNGLCVHPVADEAIAMDVKSCQASIAECTAKNPIYCPYHGSMLLQEDIRKRLETSGVQGKITVEMERGDSESGKGFSVTVHCPASQAENVQKALASFMSQSGITPNDDEQDTSYDKTEKGITAYFDVDVLKADEPPADTPASKESDDEHSSMTAEENKVGSEDIWEDAIGKIQQADGVSGGMASAYKDMLAEYKETGKFSKIELTHKALEEYFRSILGSDHPIFAHKPEQSNSASGEGDESAELENQVADGFPKLPPLPDTLDGLSFVKSLGGSTGADLYEDADGNKFVMKRGGDGGGDAKGHLINEYNGLKAYRALGVFCPDARLYGEDGDSPVMLENFIEGAELGHYLDECSKKERDGILQQIKDTCFADIVLGNWDAAGNADSMGNYPNMIVSNGKLCRIDPGGWGKFRAMGSLKKQEDWADGNPNELFSMRNIGTIAPFIGDMSVYELSQRADAHDYDGMLDIMPAEDRSVLEKRISGIRKIAARGRNYVIDGGYKNLEFVDRVLSLSYEAEKDGAAESLAYRDVTINSAQGASMSVSAMKANVGSSSETEDVDEEINDLNNELFDLEHGDNCNLVAIGANIECATASANFHLNNPLAGQLNQKKLDIAIKYEGKLIQSKKQIQEAVNELQPLKSSDESTLILGNELGLEDNYSSFYADTIDTCKRQLKYIQSCLEQIENIKMVKSGETTEPMEDWKPDDSLIKDHSIIHLGLTSEEESKIDDVKEKIQKLNDRKYEILHGSGSKKLHGKSPVEIVKDLCRRVNVKYGLSASWDTVDAMLYSQGYDTWPSGISADISCMKMKIAELEAMGVDWKQKPQHSKTLPKAFTERYYIPQYLFTDNGDPVYVGTLSYDSPKVSDPKTTKDVVIRGDSSGANFDRVVEFEKNAPKADHDSLMWSVAAMKAVQSLIFENSSIEGATKDHVLITRSLPYELLSLYSIKQGKWNYYPSGTSESSAYGKLISVNGGNVASQCDLPVSRICGMFTWGDPFNHYGENEFGTNLVGIPQFVATPLSDDKPKDTLYDVFDEFRKNNPTPNEQNSVKFVPSFN